MSRRHPVALRLEHPRQQLLGRLARIEVEQVLVLGGQHQPRFELQQRGDEDEELRCDLEVEFAACFQDVHVRQDDVGQLDFQQVDLLTEDERQKEIEGAAEDFQVELELGEGRAHGPNRSGT